MLLMLLSLLSDFLEFNERFSKMNSTSICEAVTDAIPCLRRRFYRHLNFVATTLLRFWFGPPELSHNDNDTRSPGVSDTILYFARNASSPTPPMLSKQSDSLETRAIGIGDICSVQGQRSTLVDHYIFFMGGGYKIVGPDGNVSDWTSEHVLFSLDLSSTFPVETLLSPDFLHNTSIPLDIVPSMLSQTESNWAGALFASNDSIYVYGGGDLSGAAENILASYNVTTSTWNPVTVSGGDFENNPCVFG
ncbi:MAG: hypothetical protein FRX48_05151 [Lasallia pustulata]|uniref:Kelch-type beta propeller n=1 Tax=Lasallia pustulata TaxID=136370 RepID=A0A5M8PMS3_9LECA|nr:MAG: hypothetical protein FRX48_05151 [Lasallia pustulata]